MIHISKFGVPTRVANVNEVAKVGDIVKVKVYNVDKEKGRIGLEKIISESEKAEFDKIKKELEAKKSEQKAISEAKKVAEKSEQIISELDKIDSEIGK